MARQANAKNIIVGAGALYLGPEGVENTGIVPTDPTRPLTDPANVDTAGAATGRVWEYAGYTTEGVTLNFEPDYGEIQVDQLLDVARIFKQSQRVSLQTTMAEATLENLYVALGAKSDDYYWGTAGNPVSSAPYGDTGGKVLEATDPAANSEFLDVAAANTNSLAQINGILEMNGGALAQSPLERSICVVGAGPEALVSASTEAVERIYLGYRALSVETVSNAIRRDEGTFFAANFRMMPSSTNVSTDGNPAYGRIVDRVYDTVTAPI